MVSVEFNKPTKSSRPHHSIVFYPPPVNRDTVSTYPGLFPPRDKVEKSRNNVRVFNRPHGSYPTSTSWTQCPPTVYAPKTVSKDVHYTFHEITRNDQTIMVDYWQCLKSDAIEQNTPYDVF